MLDDKVHDPMLVEAGDPPQSLRSLFKRWAANVDTSGGPDACWPWTGYRSPENYGRLRIRCKKGEPPSYAHRVGFELFRGPIPRGTHILHRCDNPPCCNPDHLFAGSCADNMKDMTRKGRHAMLYTDSQIQTVREMLAAGKFQTEIARIVGMSQPHISRIKRGVTR